jgi:type IV fimbrial biogenesis protein FimT
MNACFERPHSIDKRCDRGFSLIELMVGVAILGILAALAAPSFSESIKRYRINAIREDLGASMQLARVEAIRRGIPVVLIRELNSASCSAELLDSDTWSCGWRIVVDANSNGTISTTERNSAMQTSTMPAGYSLMHPGLGNQMIFGIWGQATGVGQRFVITPPEGVSGSSTTTLCINSGGRIRTLKGEATCP